MKHLLFTFLLFSSIGYAQNPASPAPDSSASLPERSFEVFWRTFDDHYAFFKLRNVDWKATYQKYRPMIGATTTDDSLFSVLSQMVAPLHDNHVNIIIPGKKQFTSRRATSFVNEFPTKASRDSLWMTVDATLTNDGFSTLKSVGPEFRGTPLFSYATSDRYGYIRLGRCFVSEETSDDMKADSALAGQLLDSVLKQMSHSKAIILDIRNNIGGNDEFSYAMASRFVQKKTLGHSKQTRIRGTEKFTALEKWYITPHSNTPYTKPVLLLTNNQTASAGDVLAMIMETIPQVTLVGDNTLGIYSDMYGFELPNQWLISLSNQKYFSAKMVCYEGKGTPVDIRIRNTKQDIKTGKDPVVSAALKVLEKK